MWSVRTSPGGRSHRHEPRSQRTRRRSWPRGVSIRARGLGRGVSAEPQHGPAQPAGRTSLGIRAGQAYTHSPASRGLIKLKVIRRCTSNHVHPSPAVRCQPRHVPAHRQAAMADACPVQWAGRQALVALPEHVNASNAGLIHDQLLTLVSRGAAVLIADMTATVSCDHSGADALVSAYQRASVNGAQLRLVVTAHIIRHVLEASGLDRMIPIYPTTEAAAAAGLPAAVIPLAARPSPAHTDTQVSPRGPCRPGPGGRCDGAGTAGAGTARPGGQRPVRRWPQPGGRHRPAPRHCREAHHGCPAAAG